MPADTPKATALLMLRTMLAERFGLKVHWDRKEIPTYTLVVNKGGPKLKPSAPKAAANRVNQPGEFAATASSIQRLIDLLNNNSDRPVIDQTGLTGLYDIALHWTPEFDDPSDVKAADRGLFAAMESQLGLKLERSKSATDVLIVDHVVRVPVEN
jgi:uncharacterized protein (TIGR03435 family)